jgi:transposase
MLSCPPSVEIYLANTPVDLRKGFDGLMAIVQSSFGKDVFSGHLFCFIGKRRDKVKVLFWDRGGFVIYFKRLERGRFCVPRTNASGTILMLEASELAMLLAGMDLTNVQKPKRWAPPTPVL